MIGGKERRGKTWQGDAAGGEEKSKSTVRGWRGEEGRVMLESVAEG